MPQLPFPSIYQLVLHRNPSSYPEKIIPRLLQQHPSYIFLPPSVSTSSLACSSLSSGITTPTVTAASLATTVASLPLPPTFESLPPETIRAAAAAAFPYGFDPKVLSQLRYNLVRSVPSIGIGGPLSISGDQPESAGVTLPPHQTPLPVQVAPSTHPPNEAISTSVEESVGTGGGNQPEEVYRETSRTTDAPKEEVPSRAVKTEDMRSQLAKYHTNHLMKYIRNLRKEEHGLDAILLCDGGHAKAHCCILACASPFLKKVLMESKEIPAMISLPGISVSTMENLISCIYAGTLPATANLRDVIVAAEHLGMNSLVNVLHQTIPPFLDTKDYSKFFYPELMSKVFYYDQIGAPPSIIQDGSIGPDGRSPEKSMKKKGNRLDQILYQKLNANHLAPEHNDDNLNISVPTVACPVPVQNPFLPENCGILGELLTKNDFSRTGFAAVGGYPNIDAGRHNAPLNLSKSKMGNNSSSILSSCGSATAPPSSGSTTVASSSKNHLAPTTYLSNAASIMSAASGINPSAFNLVGFPPLAGGMPGMFGQLPTGTLSHLINPSAFAASLTSAVSNYAPFVHNPSSSSATKTKVISSSLSKSRHSKMATKPAPPKIKTPPAASGTPPQLTNVTNSQHGLPPLLYSLKAPTLTPEIIKDMYEHLKINPQLSTSLASINSLPPIPNLGNPAAMATFQSLQTNNSVSSSSPLVTQPIYVKQDLHQNDNVPSSQSSYTHPPPTSSPPPSTTPMISESGALNLSFTSPIDISKSNINSPVLVTGSEINVKCENIKETTPYLQEPIDFTSGVSASITENNKSLGTPPTSEQIQPEQLQKQTEPQLLYSSSGVSLPSYVSSPSSSKTIKTYCDTQTESKSNSNQVVNHTDHGTQTLTTVLAPTSTLINSSVLMSGSNLLGRIPFDSHIASTRVSGFTSAPSLDLGTLGLQGLHFTIPNSLGSAKYPVSAQIPLNTHTDLKVESAPSPPPNGPMDLSPVSAKTGNVSTNAPTTLQEETVSDSMASEIDVVGSPSAPQEGTKSFNDAIIKVSDSSPSFSLSNFHVAMPLVTSMSSETCVNSNAGDGISSPVLLQQDFANIQQKDSKPATPDSIEVIEETVVNPERSSQMFQQRKHMFQSGSMGRKRKGCGECEGCQVVDDCGNCRFCRDKAKFGGPNRLKQVCVYKRCVLADVEPDEGRKKRKNLNRRKPTRCGSCDGCQRTSDCGDCYACLHNAAAQPPARKKICEMRVCEQQQIEEVRASLNVAEEPSPYSTDSLLAEGVVLGGGLGSSRTSSPSSESAALLGGGGGTSSTSLKHHKLKLSKKAAKKLNQSFCRVSPSKVRTKYYCGECPGCLTTTPCGNCLYCEDMPKFGGPGRYRQLFLSNALSSCVYIIHGSKL
ncbi:CXXC-type zinc finger protein 1 [Armadillidium vulgare]|nr:CXXC-type zinc finger protein 1 [Armadillidium vulgare]